MLGRIQAKVFCVYLLLQVEIIGQHMKDFVLKDDLHVICAQLKRLRVNASEQAAGLGEQFTRKHWQEQVRVRAEFCLGLGEGEENIR